MFRETVLMLGFHDGESLVDVQVEQHCGKLRINVLASVVAVEHLDVLIKAVGLQFRLDSLNIERRGAWGDERPEFVLALIAVNNELLEGKLDVIFFLEKIAPFHSASSVYEVEQDIPLDEEEIEMNLGQDFGLAGGCGGCGLATCPGSVAALAWWKRSSRLESEDGGMSAGEGLEGIFANASHSCVPEKHSLLVQGDGG